MKVLSRGSLILILSLILGGTTEQPLKPEVPDWLSLITDPLAADQIYNEGTSSPTISFSLVQGGISEGTIDGGFNIEGEAVLVDAFGADTALGSSDDDLTLSSFSPALDAGNNAALPADRFDLDGDGNQLELLPMDRSGNQRIFDGGTGTSTTDIGAYEFGAPVATLVREQNDVAFEAYLSQPFPNPTREALYIDFGVTTPSSVRLTVYDALGREVRVAYENRVEGGRDYRIELPTTSLAAGVYFLRLEADQVEVTRQFVLSR